MPRFLKFLLATLRLNRRLVCELSAPLGMNDFHDYPDESDFAPPMHDYVYKCSRCGKEFTI